MADPGFPRRGEGGSLLFGKFFCQKIHENEKNWTGGARVPSALTSLDPPLIEYSVLFVSGTQCTLFSSTVMYRVLQVMPRLMIGTGRPADKADVVDYVLEEFTPDQLCLVDSIMSEALRTMMSHMEKKCAEITEAKTRTEETDTQGND